MKEHQASPELQLFFERLLDLKEELKHKAEQGTSTEAKIYKDIYTKLDAIIKKGE